MVAKYGIVNLQQSSLYIYKKMSFRDCKNKAVFSRTKMFLFTENVKFTKTETIGYLLLMERSLINVLMMSLEKK